MSATDHHDTEPGGDFPTVAVRTIDGRDIAAVLELAETYASLEASRTDEGYTIEASDEHAARMAQFDERHSDSIQHSRRLYAEDARHALVVIRSICALRSAATHLAVVRTMMERLRDLDKEPAEVEGAMTPTVCRRHRSEPRPPMPVVTSPLRSHAPPATRVTQRVAMRSHFA